MKKEIKKMIEEYQCPGCVCGSNVSCYKKEAENNGVHCFGHVAGTRVFPHIGLIFLGLPVGFCRLGQTEKTQISIFETVESGWGYNKFNIPVWKYLDKNGNTLVRGICPRINMPWIHIFMGDVITKIDCFLITQNDLDNMD